MPAAAYGSRRARPGHLCRRIPPPDAEGAERTADLRCRCGVGASAVTGPRVGADGAWSRVRPLLSDATSEYIGDSVVETYLIDLFSEKGRWTSGSDLP
ncbi:hypothetical protein BZZ08_00743 [Streptomyces sp. MH60]|uniref:hypothetical protein n=1 Tax=Streptomyces sp. MH60 TaxID=1940758 RepID=UPI000CEE1D2F|nr:hypothetical protein [Streptomyces sp. MH60]PPS90627.1 hypothetical protein BZZ08_00743 [Streptomyces sp. MH60]